MRVRYLILLLLVMCGCRDAAPAGDLPEHVYFRDNTSSHNSRYYAAIQDGEIWVKPNTDRTGEVGPWQLLDNLPCGLAGDVTEISMDDEHIIALNSARQVYTMWAANQDISEFRWQKRWGFPFWQGPGLQLREDIRLWNFSVVSPLEDGCWTDPAGNLQLIDDVKCSHIVMLEDGGNTICFNDPWLPLDYSYGIGTPYRGRFICQSLSSSGSTHFIINRYGDMYTRLFDFDISGFDGVFMACSYEDQRGLEDHKFQMPAEDWAMQPKIKTSGQAVITDRISITKIGRNCVERILRVEGRNAEGKTGFYEKDIREPAWRFVETGLPLKGKILDNRPDDDMSGAHLVAISEDRYYARNLDAELPQEIDRCGWIMNQEWAAELLDFNPYQTPATLRIHLGSEQFDLRLHYRDTIRVLPRARGVDAQPRLYQGAIEVPPELEGASGLKGKFISDYLADKRWTEIKLIATADEVVVSGSASHGRAIMWSLGHPEEEK